MALAVLEPHLQNVLVGVDGDGRPVQAVFRDLEGTAEHGWPPELRAVLAGVPLPGQANLRLRWYRDADREAAYVPVPNPLRGLDYPDPDISDPDYPHLDYPDRERLGSQPPRLTQLELA